jgi:hypothetical protein
MKRTSFVSCVKNRCEGTVPQVSIYKNTDGNFTLYLPCIFVQLINSHQQMHQNKFVTDFFIKSLPQ